MNKTQLHNLFEDITYAYCGYVYDNMIEHYDEIISIINNDNAISVGEGIVLQDFFKSYSHLTKLFNTKSLVDIIKNDYDNDEDVKDFIYYINDKITFMYVYKDYDRGDKFTRAQFYKSQLFGTTYFIRINVYRDEVKSFLKYIKELEQDAKWIKKPIKYFKFASSFLHELNHLYNSYMKTINNGYVQSNNSKKHSSRAYYNNRREVDARLTQYIFDYPMFKYDEESNFRLPIGYNKYAKDYITYCNLITDNLMTDRNIKRGLRKLYKIYHDSSLKSKISQAQETLQQFDQYQKLGILPNPKKSKITKIKQSLFSKLWNIIDKIIIPDDEK